MSVETAVCALAAAGDDRATAGRRLVAALQGIDALLGVLSQIEARDLPADVLHRAAHDLEITDRRLNGVRAALYTTIEAEGLWASDGTRSFTAWVRKTTQSSPARAGAHARLARALRDHLPTTAAALTAGTITTEHASTLAKYTTCTPDRLNALTDPETGEAFLVAKAAELDATDFTQAVRYWAITADPESGDRQWRGEIGKEELVLSRTLDGYHLQGWLNDVNGAALDTALRARTGTPAPGDQRTTAQRRAGSLNALVRLVLDSGTLTPHAASHPHLNIHVPYDTLERLATAQTPHPTPPGPDLEIPGDLNPDTLRGAAPATLEDGTALPHALLARLACDSQLNRIVFGPDSEILDSGRTRRLFTPGQRRAIIARDNHCQYPGCDAPPHEGEIHHTIWWYTQHGHTRTQDGILLCWYHHDHVHAHNITIKRAPTNNPTAHKRWQFTRHNGQEIPPPNPGNPRSTDS